MLNISLLSLIKSIRLTLGLTCRLGLLIYLEGVFGSKQNLLREFLLTVPFLALFNLTDVISD